MTAGYSGKPLWQKLGLKEGQSIRVFGHDGDYPALVGCRVGLADDDGPQSFMHGFVTTETQLGQWLETVCRQLEPDGAAWASWPKKSSGVPTTLTEDAIRARALPLGLVDVKVCAVDEVWSGLKLVVRKDLRATWRSDTP